MNQTAFCCIEKSALMGIVVLCTASCGVGGSTRTDAGTGLDGQAGCPPFEIRCQGTCVNPQSERLFCGATGPCVADTAGEACGSGEVCVAGACVQDCPTGQLKCDSRCVDPLRDREFCGATGSCSGAEIGSVCSAGSVCVAGVCAPNCPTGQLACEGQCVDPSRDRRFCGATGSCAAAEAGTECLSGQVCVAGACITSCPTGQLACQGQCVEPLSDPIYCGASGGCGAGEDGTPCVAGEVCNRGVCQTSCPTGQVACGGRCVDPLTDLEFCGASGDCGVGSRGTSCVAGEVCSSGACAPNCPLGQVFCGSRCVDPDSDNVYCGASGDCSPSVAGEVCAAGRVCVTGACEVRCVAGQLVCDDRCVDPLTDRTYCGASGDCTGALAGTPCNTGEICQAGTCTLNCTASQVPCDGMCIDPLSDREHCGASADCIGPTAGVKCNSGELCQDGSCQLNCTSGQLLCDGRCVDPMSDRVYCGAIGDCMGANAGTPCSAGEVCSAGLCALSCGGGLTECVGQCVDTTTNPGFCGGCGTVCPAPSNAQAVCIASVCDAVCNDGFVDCNDSLSLDGCEANLDTDPLNCGACDLVCPSEANAVPGCSSKSCTLACKAGFVDCNGDLGSGGNGCELAAATCPTARWWSAFGDSSDDRVIRDVAAAPDGSVYVLGQYETSILIAGETLSSARYGAYLAKFDGAGTLLWARNIASTVQDAFADRVALDATGNVFVVGYWFRGNLTVGATVVANAGSERGFAAKLDSNGAVVWARDLINGRVRGSVVDGATLLVTGQFNATESLDAVSFTHSGSTSDGYVAVLSGNTGDALAGFVLGGSSADELPYGISVSPAGHVAVVGVYRLGAATIGSVSLPAGGMNDGFVASFSNAGVVRWAQSLAAASNESLWDVVTDPSDHVYVSGHNGSGAYLARHNVASGSRDWSAAMAGGNSFSGAERLILDGTVVRTVFQFLGSGTFVSTAISAVTNSGVVAEVDRNGGSVVSAKALTFANPLRFHALAPHPDGGSFVGASFKGPITVDGSSVPHAGDWDDLVLALYPL